MMDLDFTEQEQAFRAECRASALTYAEQTDLYSMHRTGAALIESLLRRKQAAAGD